MGLLEGSEGTKRTSKAAGKVLEAAERTSEAASEAIGRPSGEGGGIDRRIENFPYVCGGAVIPNERLEFLINWRVIASEFCDRNKLEAVHTV